MAFVRLNRSIVLMLGASLGCFLPRAASQSKPEGPEERIHRIEASVVNIPLDAREQPLQMDLKRLMATFKVPGLSMAVIDDYQIAWTRTYGVTDAGSNKAVTTTTLFQAGSISKPVAAAGALVLVEQGKLSLDEDLNLKLKSWKVPENDFTKSEKVTLRRLMSHTAGLTVHGFPGYEVDASLPNLAQIFNGEKPANTAPIRVDTVPGTEERYSGGGVTIEQQLMIDVTGKPFPALMREAVFDKIGMANSSYEQPLPAPWAARTACGTTSDGNPVHGRWHIYPEMAAAGLWTMPTDLAKFAIEIALSKQGRANHILSEKMTKEMLTPVMDDAGLGFFLEKGNPGQFGHNGADEGFQALLEMNAQTGKGLVIMANSDRGLIVAGFLLASVAKEYGWNYKSPGGEFGTLLVLAKVKGAPAALERYTALKSAEGKDAGIDEGTLNGLGYMLLNDGQEQDAIAIFKRNVQEYPESSNVYDSLGEAYMKTGQKALAIANYEKSLERSPKNQNGVDMLKKLKDSK